MGPLTMSGEGSSVQPGRADCQGEQTHQVVGNMTGQDSAVQVKPLDVDNYAVWSARMKMLLISKKLWAVVKETKANEEDSQKALAIMGLHVADFHLQRVMSANSAKELWDSFEATYKAKNNARRVSLRKELNSLQKQPSEPLTKYTARAKSLWSDLVATGHEMKETELCWTVLSGLPKEYDIVVTILESSTEELSLDAILPQLLQVEQRQSMAEDTVKVFGARSSNGFQRDRECYYCGEPGHIKANCQKRIRDKGTRRTVAF